MQPGSRTKNVYRIMLHDGQPQQYDREQQASYHQHSPALLETSHCETRQISEMLYVIESLVSSLWVLAEHGVFSLTSVPSESNTPSHFHALLPCLVCNEQLVEGRGSPAHYMFIVGAPTRVCVYIYIYIYMCVCVCVLHVRMCTLVCWRDKPETIG